MKDMPACLSACHMFMRMYKISQFEKIYKLVHETELQTIWLIQ